MDSTEKMTNGTVIWLTGLSAAGKSTIAKEIQTILQEKGIFPLLLDGDEVRTAINDLNCGHDSKNRLLNAYRISRFANLAARQGLIVIVATMSLFHEIHDWNRQNFPKYFEVLIQADMETLKKRDPKGLYKKISAGKEKNMPGVDLEPQFPQKPDLIIDNNQTYKHIRNVALQILTAMEK